MHFSKVVAAAAMAGLVSAQSTNTTLVSSPQNIDPNSVSQTERDSWCLGQRNTCRSVCMSNGGAASNDCFQANLTYSCQCANGPQPNITDYQQSLPAQVCRVFVNQCVVSSGSDLDAITACRNIICGNRTISATTSTTASSSSTSSTGPATAASSSAAPSSTPSGSANLGLYVAESYGLGLFASVVLAVVGFAL